MHRKTLSFQSFDKTTSMKRRAVLFILSLIPFQWGRLMLGDRDPRYRQSEIAMIAPL